MSIIESQINKLNDGLNLEHRSTTLAGTPALMR